MNIKNLLDGKQAVTSLIEAQLIIAYCKGEPGCLSATLNFENPQTMIEVMNVLSVVDVMDRDEFFTLEASWKPHMSPEGEAILDKLDQVQEEMKAHSKAIKDLLVKSTPKTI